MSDNLLPVYVILGVTGSGRREILTDLIDAGFPSEAVVQIHISQEEADSFSESFAPSSKTWIGKWHIEGNAVLQFDPGPEAVARFFIADGRGNPIDFLEALSNWYHNNGQPDFTVLTVVDCERCAAHKAILDWYRACIHFTDIVLLNRRTNISSKWITDFREHFTKAHYPCIFEFVKKGKIANPAALLDTPPRRLSLAFEATDHPFEDFAEDEDEDNDDSDFTPDAVLQPSRDPWFERLLSHHRKKKIPDIRTLLDNS